MRTTRWARWLALGFALLVTVVAQPALASKPAPTCMTPRNSADSVFLWQLGEPRSLAMASACFERNGRTPEQLKESARRLKAVYDAQGAFVVMDGISDDADWLDSESGSTTVVPHGDLPNVVIEKRGQRWLWTAPSLDWIDKRYADSLQGLDSVLEKLPKPLRAKLFGVAIWQYLALLLLLLAGVVVRKLLQAVVAVRIKRLSEKLDQQWPGKLIDVIASPGATLVTAIILRLGYPQLRLPIAMSSAMSSAVRVLITLSIVWAAYRSVDLLSAYMSTRASRTESKLDDQLVPLIRKSLKAAVFVFGGLIVLQNLSFDVTTLVTSVSIGTLAFGLAAKDTLANLFGSVSIFTDNPFQIGDWVHVMGVDGTVEEVGFRSTRIRTFYDSVVVIPNARLADSKIDNYGQRGFRRCKLTLGLTYDTSPEQMQAFVEGCRAILQSNPRTRKDAYEVHMSGFGDSALNVLLYFFFECDTWTEELRERHNVFLEILRLARDLQVSFAFPTQSLHIESQAAANPPARGEIPGPEQLREVVLGYGPDGDRARPAGPIVADGRFLPLAQSKPGETDG